MKKLVMKELYKMYKRKAFYITPIVLAILMLLVGIFTVHDSDPQFYISAAFAGYQWGTIMLIIVTANIVSMDFEYGTIKYLVASDNRIRIFFSKIIAILFYDIYVHILAVGFTFIIKLFIYGKTYPLGAVYLYHQSLGSNLLVGALVDFIGSFIIISIVIFLACIVKTSAVAIASGIAICFVGQGISNMLIRNAGTIESIISWNPFNMLNITNEWSNPQYYDITRLSTEQLLVGNLVYTAIFLLIGMVFFGLRKN